MLRHSCGQDQEALCRDTEIVSRQSWVRPEISCHDRVFPRVGFSVVIEVFLSRQSMALDSEFSVTIELARPGVFYRDTTFLGRDKVGLGGENLCRDRVGHDRGGQVSTTGAQCARQCAQPSATTRPGHAHDMEQYA